MEKRRTIAVVGPRLQWERLKQQFRHVITGVSLPKEQFEIGNVTYVLIALPEHAYGLKFDDVVSLDGQWSRDLFGALDCARAQIKR